jgi:hypothetical protein
VDRATVARVKGVAHEIGSHIEGALEGCLTSQARRSIDGHEFDQFPFSIAVRGAK